MQVATEIRFMTDSFRVHSSHRAPLFQIPPQKGFPTVQSRDHRVSLRNEQGNEAGFLYPMRNEHADAHLFSQQEADVPVCVVEESHSPLAAIPDLKQRRFPSPGLESFLCTVTYGVEVAGMRFEATVKGPRMVAVGSSYSHKEDRRTTADLEIVEMYLAGFDGQGGMITVRGGSKLSLPVITGEMKACSTESDFPAELYFDLILEVAYWGAT